MAKKKRSSVWFDRDSMTFIGLDDVMKKHLQNTFKNINIDFELNKMSLWLCSTKGMKRIGDIGFIMNWLNNAAPSSPSVSIQKELINFDEPLRHLINEYLEGLWKNREHILELNTIQKKKKTL